MITPLHKNYGHRCAQATMKSVLKVRLPNRNFTFEELDNLTLHQDPQITLPIQIAYGFHQLQVPFEYYIKPEGLTFAQSPNIQNYTQKAYGSKVTSNMNFIALNKSIKEVQNSSGIIAIKDKLPIETLERKIQQEKIPICLVNWDVFNKKPNKFSGHYIILTEFRNDEIIYHDSGPYKAGLNKKISKSRFQKAWNLCLMDHDLIIV